MKRVVVDASIAIKWFVPEIFTEQAILLLREDIELHAPDLLYPEFCNIVWKKTVKKEFSYKEAREVVSILGKIPIIIHASQGLLEKSLNTALSLGDTVYDCLYLTLAEMLLCQLITADRIFFEKTKKNYVVQHICWIGDFSRHSAA